MITSPDAQWLLSIMHKQHNNPTLADIERFCELVANMVESGEVLEYAREMAFNEIMK